MSGVISFIKDAMTTWRKATFASYPLAEDIQILKYDVFERHNGESNTERLRSDQQNIRSDIRRSYNKLILQNG